MCSALRGHSGLGGQFCGSSPISGECRMKRTLAPLVAGLLTIAALAACSDGSTPAEPRGAARLSVALATEDVIPGRFIVTLRAGARPADVASEHAVSADFIYTHALNGFAGAMSD